MDDDAPLTGEEVEAHLRRRDPDRWLSARLIADPVARRGVLALYAFEDAIRSVAGAVTNPLLGEMRFAWWSEAVEGMAAGRPLRAHPALLGIAPLVAEGRVKPEPLLALIGARLADLDPAPFADDAALDRFLEGAYAAPMRAGAALLDPSARAAPLTATGRAWGLASLLRDSPRWSAAGRRWAPSTWRDDPNAHARTEIAAALVAAKAEVTALPVPSFPAVAHAALAKAYADGREPGDLEKRARLLWASARGGL